MLIATSLARNLSYKIVKSCSAPNFKGVFAIKHETCENDYQFFFISQLKLKKRSGSGWRNGLTSLTSHLEMDEKMLHRIIPSRQIFLHPAYGIDN